MLFFPIPVPVPVTLPVPVPVPVSTAAILVSNIPSLRTSIKSTYDAVDGFASNPDRYKPQRPPPRYI